MATLFTDLVREVADLVRNEFALARAEFAEKADRATGGVVLLALGALVSFAAIIAALRALVFTLAEIMGEAVAGLAVGGGASLVGLLLILWGRRSMAARAPRRVPDSLRDSLNDGENR